MEDANFTVADYKINKLTRLKQQLKRVATVLGYVGKGCLNMLSTGLEHHANEEKKRACSPSLYKHKKYKDFN